MLTVILMLLTWTWALPTPYESVYTDEELFQSLFTAKHLSALRNETEALFNFAWDSYMNYGFPHDEVAPLTCEPVLADPDWSNIGKNDVLGGISLTLFDAMDTFVIMNDKDKFHECIRLIIQRFSDFSVDSIVQVFEMNIRVLGGLLSGHLFAVDERRGFHMEGYEGQLLTLAYDLGKRLAVTYQVDSASDMVFNFPRVNLKWGPKVVPGRIQSDQCTSGMGSLILEFSLLSRLTNDTIFEDLARQNVQDVWNRRSNLDLVPMSFNTNLQKFTNAITGTGASIDSFYEYLLKYSILFDDEDYADMWQDAYRALLTHSKDEVGIFHNVDATTGMVATEWIDALGAFLPGLQVLAGDVNNAMRLHLVFLSIWNHYGGLPERWNFNEFRSLGLFDKEYHEGDTIDGFNLTLTDEILLKNSVGLEWYPLRPEFIESSYHLYQATRDPLLLRIGESILQELRTRFIAPCGFAGYKNIITGERENRMESFVLSETFKYLYLLFSHRDNSTCKLQEGNTVFSTEGHLLWWDTKLRQFEKVTAEDLSSMNKVNETDNEDTKQWLWSRKRFDLNKSFANLKRDFYSTPHEPHFVDRMTPHVKRELGIDDKYYTYGIPMMTDADVHSHIKSINERNFQRLTETLQSNYNVSIHRDLHGPNQCLVADRSEFIWSNAMQGKTVYDLDRAHPMTLRKTPHMHVKRAIELNETFYSRFVPEGKESEARLGQRQWEALVASENNYNIAPIYTETTGNIYIHEMEGLRVRFKDITTNGTDILQFVGVNGVSVGSSKKVYVNGASSFLLNSEAFSVAHNELFLNGMAICNVEVLC